jgi:hypothetical protein
VLKTEQMTTLEKKIEHFARILASRPGDELTILALAEASFRRGLKLEALTAYQDVVSGRPVPEAHLAVAEIYSVQGMTHEAYGELRQLFEVDPENVEARLLVNALQEDALPPEDVRAIMERPTSDAAFAEARLRLKIQRTIYNRELQERTRNVTLEPGTVIHEYHMEEAKKKLIRVDELLRELERYREFNHTLAQQPPRPEPVSPLAESEDHAGGPEMPSLELEPPLDEAPTMDELPPELTVEPGPDDFAEQPVLELGLAVAESAPVEAPALQLEATPGSLEESPTELPLTALEDTAAPEPFIPPAEPSTGLSLLSPEPVSATIEPMLTPPTPEPLLALSSPARGLDDAAASDLRLDADFSVLGSAQASMAAEPLETMEAGVNVPPSTAAAAETSAEGAPPLEAAPSLDEPGPSSQEREPAPHLGLDMPPLSMTPVSPGSQSSFSSDFDIGMDSLIAPDLPDLGSEDLPSFDSEVPQPMVDLAPIDMAAGSRSTPEAPAAVAAEPEPVPDPASSLEASAPIAAAPPTIDDAPVRPDLATPVAPIMIDDSTMILTAPAPDLPGPPSTPVAAPPAIDPSSGEDSLELGYGSAEVEAPQELSAARKAFYETHSEALSGLTTTLARTRGVTSIYLVAREGVTIDSVAKDEISEKRVGDLVRESFEFLEAFASDPAYWVLECAGGIFVMQKLDERHVLIAIGQAGANFGALRYTMDKTRTKFEQLLGQAPE